MPSPIAGSSVFESGKGAGLLSFWIGDRQMRVPKNAQKVGRVGAVGFAVGLFLAGPQAVAAADSQDGTSPGASAAEGASAPGKAPGGRGAVRSKASPAGHASGSVRSAGRVPVSAPAPAAARSARSAAAIPGRGPAVRVSSGPAVGQSRASAVAGAPEVSAPDVSVTVATVASGFSESAVVSEPIAIAVASTATAPPVGSGPFVTAAQVASDARDRIDIKVAKFFNKIANRLADLPDSQLTASLEGALLMVRRSLFDTEPMVNLGPQTVSADGTYKGRVGAVDFEGDTLVYSVTTGPQYGTVSVDASGFYAYTPADGFAGTDSFVVKVADSGFHFNLLNRANDGAREVAVQIGAAQQSDPIGADRDVADVAVYLPDATGHITVRRGLFGGFTGTVTLDADTAPDAALTWMDVSGNRGQIGLDQVVTKQWSALQAKAAENGATVDLVLAYTGADGTDSALLLSGVDAGKNAAGQYVFTGRLSADPAIKETAVDRWDVAGEEYKPLYEKFRSDYQITAGLAPFKTVEVDFADAVFVAETYTPTSYVLDGAYAFDSESLGQAAYTPAPATAAALAAATQAGDLSPIAAMTQLRDSTVVARRNGAVELWTDGKMQLLHNGIPGEDNPYSKSSWGKYNDGSGDYFPVVPTRILEYSRPLKDADGKAVANSFTGSVAGTTLTVTALGAGSRVAVGEQISGPGIAAGTVITKYLPPTVCTEAKSCKPEPAGQVNIEGGPGTYEVSIAQTVAATAKPITITQPAVMAVASGFILGMNTGSVQLWSATAGWTQLHDAGWGSKITAMATYGDGVVVGLANGSVQKWNGPGTTSDTTTWSGNWTELKDSGWDQQVTNIVVQHQVLTPRTTGTNTLTQGQTLRIGDKLISDNGAYTLKLQDDGNLVLSNNRGAPIWATATYGQGVDRVELQTDGNFVVYKAGASIPENAKWTPPGQPSFNQPNVRLVVQDDRNVVLYSNNTAVWSSHTDITDVPEGIVVSLGKWGEPGGVEYWDPTLQSSLSSPWIELKDNGWKNGVTAMVPYRNGVAVGLVSGSVQYWNGADNNVKNGAGWEELQGTGWNSEVTSMARYDRYGDGFMVGLNSGAVEYYTGGQWTELHGTEWNAAVQNITPYDSKGVGTGVVVGLSNGSVQLWKGPLGKADRNTWRENWVELHDSGWDSGVSGIKPVTVRVADSLGKVVAQDGVIVGLNNGSVEQWSGKITGSSGQGDWRELAGQDVNRAAEALTPDTLKTAVAYAKKVVAANNTEWAKGDNAVGGAADPIFSVAYFQPASDVKGVRYPITLDKKIEALDKEFKGGDASVKLAYDVNAIAYGYAFIPDSVTDKFLPGKYSAAMLVGIETGPRLTVNVQSDGSINSEKANLLNFKQVYTTPYGMFSLGAGVDGQLSAQLVGLPENPNLTAYAYMVPGMLMTYNTKSKPGGMQFGFNAYSDYSFGDFAKVRGASITPTLTPYVTAGYGLFLPDKLPFVGGWSLFKLSMGYENPVSATLTVQKGQGETVDTSLKLVSKGYVNVHAGLLEKVTDALSWDNKTLVYDVSTTLKP